MRTQSAARIRAASFSYLIWREFAASRQRGAAFGKREVRMKTPTKNEWNRVETPQRHRRGDRSVETSPALSKDAAIYPWNWGEGARRIQLSPSGGNEPIDEHEQTAKQQRQSNLRRGRPRADSITGLILKGSTSPSNIKCQICNRVFPRDKSLQAHLRTHTGERPYRCDFPGCDRAFTQSGQLKTHQRLHTGEKPFVCSANGCNNSFAHANRHCPLHPFATLHRVENDALDSSPTGTNENCNSEVIKWLEKYRKERAEKPTSKLRERKLKRELDQQAYWDQINSPAEKSARQDSPGHNLSDSTDEWLGALALIELAQTNTTCQPLNLSFQK